MKKVLLAFDGIHFSAGGFEFARTMNEMEPLLLVGVFLPQVDYANLWSYPGGSPINGPLFSPVLETGDQEELERSIERFEELCKKNDIEYRIHKDFEDLVLSELKKETWYADLVIIGSESFYKNLGINEPNEYLREALHKVGCPVVIVPEKFVAPQSNILTYDGSPSSVYAIKQFSYLFPKLVKSTTLLVYADEKESDQIPNEVYITELVARHFTDLTITKLDINPKEYFATWVSERKGAIVVSGSFGRSSFSMMFKKSFITEIINGHQLPVFIAHY